MRRDGRYRVVTGTHLLLSALLLAVVAAPATAAPDPLGSHRWTSRVLVVLAPEGDDPRLAEQRRLFGSRAPGGRERDLLLVEGIGQAAEAAPLRARFGIGPSDFAVILVGKDGGEKLRSDRPVASERLFETIDAMPMRRDEMRRGKR